MILVLDNYDSFTYNLVQRLGEIDHNVDVRVVRNDKITIPEVRQLNPDRILISPGPCSPSQAGISVAIVEELIGEFPILGVCLGHQSIGQALGGEIVRAKGLMHGKTDMIQHNGKGLFAGLASPVRATRYHSLVIQPDTLSPDFEIDAWVDEPGGYREIMAIRHKQLPVFGVQFNPESFLTDLGPEMLKRFLATTA